MTSRHEVAATPRLRITTWLASDVDDLAALHGDPAVMAHLSPGRPETREEVQARLDAYRREQVTPGWTKWRVEDRSGRMVGRAGFGAHGAGRELGYTLGRDVWGRGLASELAAELVAWHHAHPLPEPAALLAFATPDNAASRRVLEKAGFRCTGIAPYHGWAHARYELAADPERDPASLSAGR
ncbi:GNAT family N-acetyltransferase [Pimelobacter simplex]|uniref:GNAT family N-acetyltransferase n=1 Tax=Nocardioides simplex TaxID=2045 RepID=UPI00366DF04D